MQYVHHNYEMGMGPTTASGGDRAICLELVAVDSERGTDDPLDEMIRVVCQQTGVRGAAAQPGSTGVAVVHYDPMRVAGSEIMEALWLSGFSTVLVGS